MHRSRGAAVFSNQASLAATAVMRAVRPPMNIDHGPLETIAFTARRVRGSKLTRVGIAIDFPDGLSVTGDADLSTGLGTLHMQNSIFKFGFSAVEFDQRVLCTFHIDHGFFRLPNVAIKSMEDDTTIVLKQRRIWSSTVDAFWGDKQIGTFASNLLQSRYDAVLDVDVPVKLGLVAIWCIMIRGAFAA
ncbi:MAG: hypothetical protein MUC43_16915 [Pirellula sp.]|jgi:hypothetical protein|nr:hypothetical protein [Pirellula sp.]